MALKVFAVLHARFERGSLSGCRGYLAAIPFPVLMIRGSTARRSLLPPMRANEVVPMVWQTLGIPFRWERTIESGQFLVNKRQCWQPLA